MGALGRLGGVFVGSTAGRGSACPAHACTITVTTGTNPLRISISETERYRYAVLPNASELQDARPIAHTFFIKKGQRRGVSGTTLHTRTRKKQMIAELICPEHVSMIG